MHKVMRLLTFAFCITTLTQRSVADDPVLGPPTWIVDAHIDPVGSRGQPLLIGTVFDWNESRQSWIDSETIQHKSSSVDASITRLRSIFMLTSKRFTGPIAALKFSRLDGSVIDPDDLPKLLASKRAIAFVPTGTGIHPAITAALHPDTIVITRVSYSSDPGDSFDPVVIPLPAKR